MPRRASASSSGRDDIPHGAVDIRLANVGPQQMLCDVCEMGSVEKRKERGCLSVVDISAER